MKTKLLIPTMVAGLMLVGCQLPDLPKIEKKQDNAEFSEKECEKLKKSLMNRDVTTTDTHLRYKLQQCERFGGADIDIDAIMEKNK